MHNNNDQLNPNLELPLPDKTYLKRKRKLQRDWIAEQKRHQKAMNKIIRDSRKYDEDDSFLPPPLNKNFNPIQSIKNQHQQQKLLRQNAKKQKLQKQQETKNLKHIPQKNVVLPTSQNNTSSQNSKPAYNQNSQPTYSQNSKPTYNQNSQPAYNQNSQPTYNQNSKPTYNQNFQPAYNQNSQPIYSQNSKPTYNQNAKSTYNQNSQQNYNKNSQPAYNSNVQPVHKQNSQPHHDNSIRPEQAHRLALLEQFDQNYKASFANDPKHNESELFFNNYVANKTSR